jgi:hypothetical protein
LALKLLKKNRIYFWRYNEGRDTKIFAN